jgi:preprotein translocase subunit SecE
MARNPSAPRRFGSQAARRTMGIRAVGDVVSELRRVTWPTRQETFRLSLMVIGVAAAVGVFLGAIDFLFSRIVGVILGG